MKQELSSLQEVAGKAAADVRRHNDPPELIEEGVSDQLKRAVDCMERIAAEVTKQEPSPTLLSILVKKLDLAVDELIKWSIRAGVGAAILAQLPEFGRWLSDFISRLGSSG